MKSQLLLWLLLLCSGSAWAQNLSVTESFEHTPGTGEGITYTSNSFIVGTTRYFIRASDPVTVSGTQTFNGGTGTMTGENGTYFWACEGVRSAANAMAPASGSVPGTVTLAGIPNTQSYTGLKVTVAAGDPKNSTNQARVTDHLRVQYSYGSESGPYTTVGEFTNTTNPTGTAVWNRTGTGSSSPQNTTTLTSTFTDHVFPIADNPGTGLLYVRIEADFNGANKELAFDNIRVTGAPSTVPKPTIVSNNGNATLTFAEGTATPLTVFSNLTLDNPAMASSPTLSEASVTITPYDATEDELTYNSLPTGITATISDDGSAHTITFSGSAGVGVYETLLESVKYKNTDANNARAGDRVFSFLVKAGTVASIPLERTITITTALNASTTLPYTENFDTDGEGTRYASNTNTGTGQGFVRLTNVSGGSSSPGSGFSNGAATTFTNLQGTGYWYANGSSGSIVSGGFGRLTLAPVNSTGFTNLHFKIKAGATTNFGAGAVSDFLRFSYSTDGTSWTTFANYTNEGSVLRLNGNAANPALGTALSDLDFTLPTSLGGTALQFRVEASSTGGEQIAFDNIQITGLFNNPPTIGNQTRSIAENSANGTNVGAPITASDTDGNTLTYAITAGNTGGTFAINNATGQLTVANSAALNFEATPAYSLTVQVTDNGSPAASASATVTVNVTNVNEAPGAVTDVNPAANTVAENAANGTAVGITASATDPDAGTTLTYSLTDNAGGRFAINASTGVVTVANGALLDFETNTSHSITVQVSDGSLTSSQSFTITVTDVDDTRPSVVITSTGNTNGGSTSTSPIPFTITFSESVTGFVQSDLTASVTGGTISGFSGSGTTYTFNVTPSGNGTVTVDVPTNVAQDAASNFNTAATQFSITYTAPSTTVVSVTRLTPSPTATTQVSYRVVFAASVTGVTIANFTVTSPSATVTGASISSTSGSGTTYTVTVNTGTGDGTLRLNVANSAGISPTVSNVPYTAGEVYTITKSFSAAPTLRIQAAGSAVGNGDVTAFVDVVQVLNASNGSAVANGLQNGSFETNNVDPNGFKKTGDGVIATPWSFTGLSGVSRNGSGFASSAADGDAVGLIQSAGDNNASISQNLAVPTGSYQVSFQAIQRNYTSKDQRLNVFLVQDGNTVFIGNIQPNSNTPPTYQSFTSATFSVTAPALTATITSSGNTNGGNTGTSPIPFTVTFSQNVTGFTASGLTVNGGTVSGFTAVNGTTYTFNVTPSGNGLVTVNVPANVALDANNTSNSAATQFSVTYTQPVTAAPVVTAPANVTLTNDNTPTYAGTAPAGSTVTVSVDGTAIGTTTATAGGAFSLTQPTALADGTHTVNATAQTVGSLVSPVSNTNGFTVDATRPTVVITSSAGASGGSTATTPIPFSVTFSETVNGSFVQGDLSVTGGTVTSFSGSGAGPYTFTVTPSGIGSTVSVNVVANVAQDAAGNFNTAAPAAYTLLYAPALSATVSTTSASPTSTSPVPFSVSFSQSVGTSFTASDVTVTGGTVTTGSFSGSGAGPYTFTVTPSGTGNVTVSLAANVAQDAATTGNSASNSVSVQFQVPTITVAPASLPNGTQGTAYSVTFSASGGSGTYTYARTAGALPIGLTLTGSTLSGTPTVSGPFTFTITATDNSAAPGPYSGSRSYTVTIDPAVVTSVTWNGNNNDDWYTASNWTPAVVPTATLDVTIPNGRPNMPYIPAGTASTRNLTINSGAALTQNGGTLDVRANLTNNGTFEPTGGTVTLGTTTAADILGSARVRFWNLRVDFNSAQLSTSAGASVRRLLTLNGTLTTNGNAFITESDATRTAMVVNNGSNVVNGNLTVQRYISTNNPGLGYRHYSAPVSNATVGSLATAGFTPVVNPAYNSAAQPGNVTPFPTVYGYDETRLNLVNDQAFFNKGWYSPNALSDALTVGKGYSVNIGGGQTFAVTGPQNNGTYSQTLTRGPQRLTNGVDQAGWHLVGNPYPAPLNYSLVAAADRVNLDAAIYIFESNGQYTGNYRSYVNGVGGDPLLAQGQGFFARVSAGQTSGTLTFRNSQRVTGYSNPAYNRTSTTRPLVQLDLQGANHADPLYVYFEQGATAGTDAEFDAVKLPNTSGLNLSAENGTDELAINALPLPTSSSNVTVPLQVRVPATGTYTLHAASIVNLPASMVAYLRDRQTGAVQDLSQQPDYTFALNAAYTGVRFELFFTPQRVTATAPASLSAQVAVFPNPAHKAVFVELPATLSRSAVTVTLVDALGRAVLTQQLAAGTTSQQLSLETVAAGVYAVRLQTAQGTVTKKLTVE